MSIRRYVFDLSMQEMPKSSLIDEMLHRLSTDLCATLLTCRGVKVKDLSEAQKYAIAVTIGVPADTRHMSHDMSRMTFVTVPCALFDRMDGGYNVIWLDDEGNKVEKCMTWKGEVSP